MISRLLFFAAAGLCLGWWPMPAAAEEKKPKAPVTVAEFKAELEKANLRMRDLSVLKVAQGLGVSYDDIPESAFGDAAFATDERKKLFADPEGLQQAAEG